MSDEFANDRKTGLQMAIAVGATKTAEVIKNSDMGFAAIFAAAEAEIGKQPLIDQILKGPAFWSHMALMFIADPGAQQAALEARAKEVPGAMLRPAAGSTLLDESDVALTGNLGGPLSSMNLHNAMAATVQWTVKWMNGGVEQPTTNYPDWNKWQWSGDITAGCGSQLALSTIAAKVPSAPLNTGDTVWIYVWVAGGTDQTSKSSPFQFTYNSGSTKTAFWTASGTTTINQLSLTDYK